MKYGLKHPRSTIKRNPQSAFTLTELLIAVMVVGILASLTIVVTTQAMYSARVEKTKSTIAKLDIVISEMYENFETRRLPVRVLPSRPDLAHAIRLWMLRDLMRMEMPCNICEAIQPPLNMQFVLGSDTSGIFSCPSSPLHNRYREALEGNCNGDFESAKCLYLIVTLGNPESRETFHDSEIATDSDGLSYFIDGWGNPIAFLRWAPGIYDSDRQPLILDDWSSGNDQDKINFADPYADPLNPIQIGGGIQNPVLAGDSCTIDLGKVWTDEEGNAVPVRAWGMVPLIVSSGGEEDGYGIDGIGNVNRATEIFIDPVSDPKIGGPAGVQNFNIITNHTSRR